MMNIEDILMKECYDIESEFMKYLLMQNLFLLEPISLNLRYLLMLTCYVHNFSSHFLRNTV